MGARSGRGTGVSRGGGIGAAIARRLAADGAGLFLTGWEPHDSDQPWGADPGGGEGVAEALRRDGARVEFLSADLADPDAPEQVMAAATSAFGRVDALVANHARSSRQSREQIALRHRELAPRRITVNCVDPGPNDTGYATGELRRRVEEAMPAGRWGRPEDAARLVSWLLSDEADWVTGQTIASDGGWSARGSS